MSMGADTTLHSVVRIRRSNVPRVSTGACALRVQQPSNLFDGRADVQGLGANAVGRDRGGDDDDSRPSRDDCDHVLPLSDSPR